MERTLLLADMTSEQDRRLSATFEQERPRLRNFIRRRLGNRRASEAEAEDILQDVFLELVEAYRMLEPLDHVSAWLFRVARNRIIDWFRKKQPLLLDDLATLARSDEEEAETLNLEELVPSPEAGPEAAFMREMLMEEIETALEELPREQREAFVAHEIEGISFKELAARTGVSVNTLLSRKHNAVLYLREQLSEIYDELLALPPQSATSAWSEARKIGSHNKKFEESPEE